MSQPSNDGVTPRRPEDVRDLQVRLYREIGISAVAAALRFTTQPEPSPRERGRELSAEPRDSAKPLAA